MENSAGAGVGFAPGNRTLLADFPSLDPHTFDCRVPDVTEEPRGVEGFRTDSADLLTAGGEAKVGEFTTVVASEVPPRDMSPIAEAMSKPPELEPVRCTGKGGKGSAAVEVAQSLGGVSGLIALNFTSSRSPSSNISSSRVTPPSSS